MQRPIFHFLLYSYRITTSASYVREGKKRRPWRNNASNWGLSGRGIQKGLNESKSFREITQPIRHGVSVMPRETKEAESRWPQDNLQRSQLV